MDPKCIFNAFGMHFKCIYFAYIILNAFPNAFKMHLGEMHSKGMHFECIQNAFPWNAFCKNVFAMHLKCIHNECVSVKCIHGMCNVLQMHLTCILDPVNAFARNAFGTNAFKMHLKCIWGKCIWRKCISNAFQMHLKMRRRVILHGHHVRCEPRCPSMHSKCISNALCSICILL